MNLYFFDSDKDIKIANIWINGGSSLDNKAKKGINHILCSLLTRGCKGYDKFSLSEYIDSYGAELNYETYEDGILFCLKSYKPYFKEVFPILLLITQEPNLDEKEFLYCKKNNLNILRKSKENIFNITYEKWRNIVFKDHPYSNNPNGNIKCVEKISYEDILNEYENFKFREKFLLTNHKLNKSINIKSIKGNLVKNQEPNFHENLKSRFICHFQNSNQITIITGNKTCSHNHNDYLPLKLLESHLSFGMSSFLFKLFREKNGLTYDSGVYFPFNKLDAPFCIYLSVSNKKALFAFELTQKLLRDLINKTMGKKDLFLAKIKLKAFISYNYQTLEDISSRKVRLLGFNIDPFYDDYLLNKIDSITEVEIMNIASKYLSKPTFSVSGNKVLCERMKDLWLQNSN